MAKIAFLGLGQMGAPMATRLFDAGHDLTVWNRTKAKMDPLVERGAAPASSPSEAAAGVDVAISMVTDPDALEQILFGSDGLARAFGAGQTLIEMSTIGPDAIRSVAERMPDGVAVIDAPVRGSVGEATQGSLLILVGATQEQFRAVEPILRTLGRPDLVGGQGAGAAMKLVVNSTLGAAIVGVGEAIAVGDALGLDRSTVLDVLGESPLGAVASGKRESIASGSYPPRFKLSLALKDLALVTQAAARAGTELKVAPASREWLQRAADAGLGDLDYSAVVSAITGGPAML